MRMVIRIVFLVVLVFVAIGGVMIFPDIQQYQNCYKRIQDKIYEKGTISAMTYKSKDQLCVNTKTYLVATGVCFLRADQAIVHQEYASVSKSIGKRLALVKYELDAMISEHNQECNFREARIVPDRDIVLE